MERTKLISLRVPVHMLEDIDKLTKPLSYMKRSFVINHLLAAMLYCCKDNGLFRVLHTYDPVGDGISIIVVEKSKL